jgi:hypothetical protein
MSSPSLSGRGNPLAAVAATLPHGHPGRPRRHPGDDTIRVGSVCIPSSPTSLRPSRPSGSRPTGEYVRGASRGDGAERMVIGRWTVAEILLTDSTQFVPY